MISGSRNTHHRPGPSIKRCAQEGEHQFGEDDRPRGVQIDFVFNSNGRLLTFYPSEVQ